MRTIDLNAKLIEAELKNQYSYKKRVVGLNARYQGASRKCRHVRLNLSANLSVSLMKLLSLVSRDFAFSSLYIIFVTCYKLVA